MADNAVAVNFPALPEYEKHDTTVQPTSGTDTVTKPVTPLETAAQNELANRTAEEIAFTDREKAQKTKTADVEKQNTDLALGVEEGLNLLRTSPEVNSARDYITKMRTHVRDEQDKLAKMPAPALFADRDGWGQVRLGISLGLAGLGDGMVNAAAIRVGGMPTNRNTAGTIIERDLQRQRDAINKQKDSVVQARTGLDDAEEARRALLADIDLKGKQMYRQVELLTRSRLAGLKLDQSAIDQTKEILDLKRAQAEKDASFANLHATSVTKRYDSAKTTNETINRVPGAGGAGGGGVEADKNAANFAVLKNHGEWVAAEMPKLTPEDIQSINRVMSTDDWLEGKGTVSTIASTLGMDSESGISSGAKAYLDHAHRAAEGLGRVQSGAAIGTVEGIRFMKSLTPKISDQPKDLAMRAENIQQDIASRGAYLARPPRNPTAGPKAAGEFTAARVEQAKGIAQDAKQPRAKRDRAREYLQAATAAGVN